MKLVDFDRDLARAAAQFRLLAPALLLAGRACLALAAAHNWPAWTADRIWSQMNLGVQLEMLR